MILQTDLDLNRAWEISPYNGLAFGALIIVLGIVIYRLYILYTEAIQYNHQQSERIHSIAEETLNKVGEIKQDREIKHEKVMHFLENISEKLKRLDNLKN